MSWPLQASRPALPLPNAPSPPHHLSCPRHCLPNPCASCLLAPVHEMALVVKPHAFAVSPSRTCSLSVTVFPPILLALSCMSSPCARPSLYLDIARPCLATCPRVPCHCMSCQCLPCHCPGLWFSLFSWRCVIACPGLACLYMALPSPGRDLSVILVMCAALALPLPVSFFV